MAKQGVVKIDDEGVTTFEDGAGVLKMLTNALVTIPSTTAAPVGYASLIQKATLVVAGNMAGVHSASGRLGVGIAGKNLYFGS